MPKKSTPTSTKLAIRDKSKARLRQVVISVKNNVRAKRFLRKNLHFDTFFSGNKIPMNLMKGYTNNLVFCFKRTFMAHLNGGAGIEICQPEQRVLRLMDKELGIASLGIICVYLRCAGIEAFRSKISKIQNEDDSEVEISRIATAPDSRKRFYFRESEYHWMGVAETSHGWTVPKWRVKQALSGTRESLGGGVCGVLIGVSNMDKSLKFYTNVLGYEIIYDKNDVFDDFSAFRSQQPVRRVMLSCVAKNTSVFSNLLQDSFIELIQTKTSEAHPYAGHKKRIWGDPGYVHMCLEVKKLDNVKKNCHALKCKFSVDINNQNDFISNSVFERSACIEDPDGTIIKLVETIKTTIFFKIRLQIRLSRHYILFLLRFLTFPSFKKIKKHK